jgi:copper ion binding protein
MSEQLTIKIKGMHCSSCVNKIKSSLGSLEGIEKIDIDLANDSASIIFDQSKVNKTQIEQKIHQAGYCTCESNTCFYNSKSNSSNKDNNWLSGIFYALIPHIGCIGFIVASVLGLSIFVEFFKPLLLNRNFFYILIFLSFVFATFSAIYYLSQNGLFSIKGIRKSYKYLLLLYGSTIGINLILFLFIFPLMANITMASSSSQLNQGTFVQNQQTQNQNNLGEQTKTANQISYLKLEVDIPCSGHAPLISSELKKLKGLISVNFVFPNIFEVKFDGSKISKEEILSLDIFNEYPAKVLEFSQISNAQTQTFNQPQIQKSNYQSPSPSFSGGSCGCGGIKKS